MSAKYNITNAEVTERLSAAGHRMTPQRRLLFDLLRETDTFIDTEQLYFLAVARESSVNMATIYRALQLFKELGLVEARYLEVDHHREYYRLKTGPESHYMTCKECGKMVPVDPSMSAMLEEAAHAWAKQHGHVLLDAHACYTGYCADCAAHLSQKDSAQPPTDA